MIIQILLDCMPKIKWTAEAVSDLKSLEKVFAKRIVNKITWFGDNFANLNLEMLSNELNYLYKVRVGNHRVVYSLHDDILQIEWIGHRKDVYKKNKK